MLAPLVWLVVGQVLPPQPLYPTGPIAPLQPTPAGPSVAAEPVIPYGPISPNDRVQRSVLTTATPSLVSPASAVGGLESTIQEATPVTPSHAARLIRDAWRQADDGAIAGQPTSLTTSLERAISNSERREIVAAYWKLATAAAIYGWASDDQRRWGQSTQPIADHEKARLRAAQRSAAADEVEAKLAMTREQLRLARLGRFTPSDTLPLPSDLPYVGRYETRFENIATSSVAAPELKQIDQALPTQRDLIEQRAEVVMACEEARDAVARAYARGQAAFGDLISTSRDLTVARESLVESIYHYNDEIARYAFSVASEGLPATTVVSMLIPTEPRVRSVLVSPSGVRQASATLPLDRPPSDPANSSLPGFREVP